MRKFHFKSDLNKHTILLLLFISFAQCMAYPIRYGDFRYGAEAGNRIFHNLDPYINNTEIMSPRFGYIAPLAMYAFAQVVPTFLGVIIIRTVSLFSIYKLLKRLFRNQKTLQVQFLFSILLWTTPIRALIDDGQYTGLLIGLFLLAEHLSQKDSSNRFTRIILLTLASICIILGVDIRPHLFLPAILFWLVNSKKYKFVFLTAVSYLLIRFSIDLLSPFNLNSKQIKILMSVNSQDLFEDITTSFWRVLEYFLLNLNVPNGFPIVLWLIFILIIITRIEFKNTNAILSAGIGSLIFTYVHPYDFLYLGIAIIYANHKKNWQNVLWLCALFLLIFPKSGTSFVLNFVYGAVVVFILRLGRSHHMFDAHNKLLFRSLVIAFGLSLLLTQINARVNSDTYTQTALLLAEISVLAVVAFFKPENKLYRIFR